MRRRITPIGPFSLEAAAGFGFGPTTGRLPRFDGAMRLAFGIDGGRGYAGAVMRQPAPDGPVEVELQLMGEGADHDADADAEAAIAQIARVLSLDHDGDQFLAVGERDPVIGRLQLAHPGQRPVLFHSPYEGAAWSIISARRPGAAAARVRAAISASLGETFELAGEALHAFPQPDRLLALPGDTPGLNPAKVERLRGVASAALAGDLDPERMHELGPERAYVEVQRLKGLGPFYAGLVVLRASGFADAALAVSEPRVLANVAQLYGLDQPPTLERFAEMAEVWRPFRTWATVLLRLGGDRERGGGGGTP